MGTNCSSSRRLVFFYSYEADFIQGLPMKNEKKLPLSNFRFGDFVDSIYPVELEIRDSMKTDRSDCEGRFRTKLYDKRDDFNFLIVNLCMQHSSSTCIWSIYLSQLVVPTRIFLIEGCC